MMMTHPMTLFRFWRFPIFAIVLAMAAIGAQKAEAVEGTVTGGRVDPLPIAISPFISGGGAEESGGTIGEVITNNLGRSGYFAPLDPASFIEQIADIGQQPRFAD